jgi:hypothetical protein
MTTINRSLIQGTPAQVSALRPEQKAQSLQLAAQLKTTSGEQASRLISRMDRSGSESLAQMTSLKAEADFSQQQPMPTALMGAATGKLQLSRMSQLSKDYQQLPEKSFPELQNNPEFRQRAGRFRLALNLLSDLGKTSDTLIQQTGSFRLRDYNALGTRAAETGQSGRTSSAEKDNKTSADESSSAQTTDLRAGGTYARHRRYVGLIDYLNPARQSSQSGSSSGTPGDRDQNTVAGGGLPGTGNLDPVADPPDTIPPPAEGETTTAEEPVDEPSAPAETEEAPPADETPTTTGEEETPPTDEPDIPEGYYTTRGLGEEDTEYYADPSPDTSPDTDVGDTTTDETGTPPADATGGADAAGETGTATETDETGDSPPADGEQDAGEPVTTGYGAVGEEDTGI